MKLINQSRVIPVLLISGKGLYKSFKFKDRKYVGDPLNAVRIFNEKQAHELLILDIDASSKKTAIQFQLLERISKVCRMPLGYGGGVSSMDDVRRLVGLGIEKVFFSSASFDNLDLIKDAIAVIGAQSICCILDYRFCPKRKDNYCFTNNGATDKNTTLLDAFKNILSLGVGEIVIHSIDRDGLKVGVDIEVVDSLYSLSNVPLTVCGGLSSDEEILSISKKYPFIGVAGGAHFVLTGKFNSVLISYLDN
jgi:cyclase